MAETVAEIGRLVSDWKEVTVPYTTVIGMRNVVERIDWQTEAREWTV
jgi:hypothetical protein